MNKIEWAIETFKKYGINAYAKNNGIIISHYKQPNGTTFEKEGINEDELIESVIGCEGLFDTIKSQLTTFPLVVSREIRLYQDGKITQMPNLKAVGIMVSNNVLKKMPKLKALASLSLENSPIKSLPKLKEVGILIAQSSALAELPSLESAKKLCIIDCPIEDLKDLKESIDIFICSSDENNKIKLQTLPDLENFENLFVANCDLKSLPKVKNAKKIALYNTNIRNIKSSLKAEIEIETKIDEEQLADKFDTFTDWYNSDIFNKSMDMLGNLVNYISK